MREPAPAGPALWTTRLDRNSRLSLSRQLREALRQSVAEGRLAAGARLPSTRALAAELRISRSTVVLVFEQLAAEGYIVSRPASGYFVPPREGAAPAAVQQPVPAGPRKLSRYAALLSPPPARLPARPFDLGYAEIDGRFVASWKSLAGRALGGRAGLEWSYGDPGGDFSLRRAIADYLAAARGVRCRPEQVVLTAGTQQGLSLAVRILLDPGDMALVEDPCYRFAVEILHTAEARIVPVPVDERGLGVAAARRKAAGGMPRLVYVTPSRQYPLGMAMPVARRLELLAWAEETGAWIIEDDYESEFMSEGRALPSLQGLDRSGRVIYLGTFSKLLFPSLRLGYAVLPEDLLPPFAAARHLSDRQSPALLQEIMNAFMREGHFARHLKRMRALYAERREFLAGLLERRLKGIVEIDPHDGGMYLIAWLPHSWSDREAAAALARREVAALPLSSLVLEEPRPPGLVLGYTGHAQAAMAQAAERMESALAEQLV
jgi:GntR family transcriptional regulator / MocR family aminotransferase